MNRLLAFMMMALLFGIFGCIKKEITPPSEAPIPNEFNMTEIHQDRSSYGTLIIWKNWAGRKIIIVVSPNGTSSVAAMH